MTISRPALTLIGGPTAIIEYGGIRLLTDPTFDEPGDYPSGSVTLHKLMGPALGADEVGAIDVVLLSHDQHPDNLDAAGRAFLPRAGVVLSTPAAASRLDGVRGLEPWQSHAVGDVEITAVPALHGPEGAEELSGPVTGFVVRAPGRPVVYVAGDNAAPALVGEIAGRLGRSTSPSCAPAPPMSAASATPTSRSTPAPRSRRRGRWETRSSSRCTPRAGTTSPRRSTASSGSSPTRDSPTGCSFPWRACRSRSDAPRLRPAPRPRARPR
ncbi:MBL fold metallo-hydrolase [Microbacterium lacticum]